MSSQANKTSDKKQKGRADLWDAACVAANAVVSSVSGTGLIVKLARGVGGVASNALSDLVSTGLCANALLRGGFVSTLAQAIDRAWEKDEEEESTPTKPASQASVASTPEDATAVPVASMVACEDDEEDEDDPFAEFDLRGVEFFDAMAQPERYQALLMQEQNGEVRIVTRYRRSFLSRLLQSQGDVQQYYSVLKNKLLSYKGVKGRISWGCESFNKGRTYVAKISAKSKSLYLYLALDPAQIAAIENDKYNITDMSSKKKYENVPVLIKITGPRKLKQALELLDLLCRETMALPAVKDFEEIDYVRPYCTTEELVAEGTIKMMVGGIPVVSQTNEATDGDVTLI